MLYQYIYFSFGRVGHLHRVPGYSSCWCTGMFFTALVSGARIESKGNPRNGYNGMFFFVSSGSGGSHRPPGRVVYIRGVPR